MVALIAYPFRLDNRGMVQKTEEGEDYYAQELASLIQTRPGERVLVPQYGITDPTFDGLSSVELIEKVTLFGPPIVIEVINGERLDAERVSVQINYAPLDPEDETGSGDSPEFGGVDENDYDSMTTINDASTFIDATEGG